MSFFMYKTGVVFKLFIFKYMYNFHFTLVMTAY